MPDRTFTVNPPPVTVTPAPADVPDTTVAVPAQSLPVAIGSVQIAPFQVDIPPFDVSITTPRVDLGTLQTATLSGFTPIGNPTNLDQGNAGEKLYLGLLSGGAPWFRMLNMKSGDYAHILVTQAAGPFVNTAFFDARVKWPVLSRNPDGSVASRDYPTFPVYPGALTLLTFYCVNDLVASPESGMILGSVKRDWA